MRVTCANERADQRLREARVVLDQDVAVAEEPEQDQLERLALADDRPLDLVQDPLAGGRDLVERQSLGQSLKRLDGGAQVGRRARPGRTAAPGAGASGRTSS